MRAVAIVIVLAWAIGASILRGVTHGLVSSGRLWTPATRTSPLRQHGLEIAAKT
jgi:hypothetical protein